MRRRHHQRRIAAVGVLSALAWPGAAGGVAAPAPSQSTQAPDFPSAPEPAAPQPAVPEPSAAPEPDVLGPCRENLPSGKERPLTQEHFPQRGLAGHSATLTVEVTHGPGERVLPSGLKLQSQSDTRSAIERAGFAFPNAKALVQPSVQPQVADGAERKTEVAIPLILLPKEPGRNELVLPSLPIAMTRASGEVITFCTRSHRILVEDPIANTPNAEPKANPKPRRQDEIWEALRTGTYATLVGVAAGLVALGLWTLWRRRPRKLPPPTPPRPAWEVALEELHDIHYAQLIAQGRLDDHFDRVSNTLRKYLGGRYGFDGLESTTREILERVPDGTSLPAGVRDEIDVFLAESDLVKFANVAPTEAQCRGGWQRAKTIVERTRPAPTVSNEVARSEP